MATLIISRRFLRHFDEHAAESVCVTYYSKMSKIKAPKMKKKAVKVADSVEDSEKPLTENDTQEVITILSCLHQET
jgi:hypothetical protein